jgi:hypothetical protein
MGRETLPVSESGVAALEDLGRRVAEAIARGDFDRARQLTEAAMQLRTAEPATSEENAPAELCSVLESYGRTYD